MKKFWMVWNPEKTAPRFKHTSFESARNEAERMAICHPGQTFHVLALVGSCVKTEVTWQEPTKPDDDVPF